jgi:hypothetical protein
MNSAEVNRVRGVRLELLTKLEYLVVDGTGGEMEAHSPDIVEQFFTRNGTARIVEEITEKLEFVSG